MKNVIRLHRLALFIVAILLTLYFWGNSQPEAAGLVPPPWDKLAHLTWYAVLAGLLLLGLGPRAWPWILAARCCWREGMSGISLPCRVARRASTTGWRMRWGRCWELE
jgi:hypothetical protein